MLEHIEDDIADCDAAKRFTEKELNLYEASIATLTERSSIQTFIDELYARSTPQERAKIVDIIFDVTQNRMTVTRKDFSK